MCLSLSNSWTRRCRFCFSRVYLLGSLGSLKACITRMLSAQRQAWPLATAFNFVFRSVLYISTLTWWYFVANRRLFQRLWRIFLLRLLTLYIWLSRLWLLWVCSLSFIVLVRESVRLRACRTIFRCPDRVRDVARHYCDCLIWHCYLQICPVDRRRL